MTKDPHAPSYIDHFLQAEIVARLTANDRPLRFSELKEAGIENSLFMYHANKLIARGLIQKNDEGFSLTLKGARWANYAGIFHDFAVTTPRPLVQFVIRDAQDHVMLAVRKGQLRQLLNDYLLPGNIYRYGLTLQDNVARILQELFGGTPLPPVNPLTTADFIHEFEDGFVHHVISHIFAVTLSDKTPKTLDHPLFDVVWTPARTITPDNAKYDKSLLLPAFFARLPSLGAHEAFVIKSQ